MEEMRTNFHKISLQDRDFLTQKLAEDDKCGCEYTFANNFVWRKVYDVEVAQIHACAVIRFRDHANHSICYSYPIGAGDKRAAIKELMDLCKKEETKLCLMALLEEDRRQMLEWFPGEFFIKPNRAGYDYIYLREKLAGLSGKKLHSKRNHIARFKENNDWRYEALAEENLGECRQMAYRWKEMNAEKWDGAMEEELEVLNEAFGHFKELKLCGGVLRNQGEVIAFCIGEPLNSDTFIVHFEKAYSNIQGAYPMINQQFAQSISEKYRYINREEDTGNPGLRKAKLSYYPEILLKKYIASERHVVYADRERDGKEIIHLWQTCFGDSERDILFYLDYRMTEDNMLAIYEDGKIVSMASFLPAEYYLGGKYEPARYVYAVATLPEYRGRGYASEILKFAGELYGELLILAPAEKSLREYYGNRGFVSAFSEEALCIPKNDIRHPVQKEGFAADTWQNLMSAQPVKEATVNTEMADCGAEPVMCCQGGKEKILPEPALRKEQDKASRENDTVSAEPMDGRKRNVTEGQMDMISLEPITPEEYVQIRDVQFEKEGYVRWDAKAIQYAMGLYSGWGGRMCAIVRENESTRREQAAREEKEILMYAIEGETLMVLETTVPREELCEMAQELMEETGTLQMVYKRMGGMVWLPPSRQGTEIPQDGYLNLTLG